MLPPPSKLDPSSSSAPSRSLSLASPGSRIPRGAYCPLPAQGWRAQGNVPASPALETSQTRLGASLAPCPAGGRCSSRGLACVMPSGPCPPAPLRDSVVLVSAASPLPLGFAASQLRALPAPALPPRCSLGNPLKSKNQPTDRPTETLPGKSKTRREGNFAARSSSSPRTRADQPGSALVPQHPNPRR